MNDFDFSGKVALVTGVSGSLGGVVARAFQAAGAHLALVDRGADRLPAMFPDLADDPGHFFCPGVDVMDADAVHDAVEAVHAYFGRIDVLANTVGGFRAGTPVHETPLSTWEFMLNLNARSAFLLSRAVTPWMIEQSSGKIVHVAARAALAGSAHMAAYTASKSALVRLVESLAAEVKDKGVNVNCVLPGTIDTAANREAMPGAEHSRWVAPDAIADVMLFLASDAARAIHGASIPVYGLS